MKNRGFTLAEIIMVIIIVGIVAVTIGKFTYQGARLWLFQETIDEMSIQARNTLDWMTREIRQVKNQNSFLEADRSKLSFTKSDDTEVTYSLEGNSILRNTDELADFVDDLKFEYRDKDNNVLGPLPLSPENREKIWRIIITVKFFKADQKLTLDTSVYPRSVDSFIY